MKQLTKLMTRLRRRKPRRQDKHGSSMALVMIITSALVIWVMCLAPLMSTTGITALKVQNGYTDYLGSRSAIEYAKSELVKIVNYDGKAPYTFAVLINGNDFMAVPKRDDTGSVTDEYKDHVWIDAINPYDDAVDKPLDNSAGKKVAAICCVIPNGMSYDIEITSYINGVKALTVKVDYTHQEKLLIYPEAYRQTEALPLSDYVLVDGKMGDRWVWHSLDEDSKGGEYEHLLPWIIPAQQENKPNYASSGKYPAVFKYTAAASAGLAGGETAEKPDTTPKNWIMPFGAEKDTGVVGVVWHSDGKAYIRTATGADGITELTSENSIIRYNGSTSIPQNPGEYCVSVDYFGTGAYKSDEGAVNIMPRYGMDTGIYTVISEQKAATPTVSIQKVTYSGGKITVELGSTNGVNVKYGYRTADNATVTWQDTNTFADLDYSKTYYFYCYTPAYIKDGVYCKSSDASSGVVVFPFKAVSSLTSGKQYLVVNKDGYAMKDNVTIESYWFPIIGTQTYEVHNLAVTSNVGSIGTFNAGVFTTVPDKSLLWTMEKGDSGWSFKQGNYEDDYYLTLNAVADRGGSRKEGYYYYLKDYSSKLVESKDQALKIENNTVSKYLSVRYYGSNYATGTVYLNIKNDKVAASETAANTYFVEIPNTTAPTVSVPSTAEAAALPSGETWKEVFANGTKIDDPSSLTTPGRYLVMGTTDKGTLVKYTVDVSKENLDNSLTVTPSKNNNDDHQMLVTGSNWHENGGIRYYGYRIGNETVYHWDYTTADSDPADSVVFMVDYDTEYHVIVRESGTWEYAAGADSAEKLYKIGDTFTGNMDWKPTDFLYSFKNEGASSDTLSNILWYSLPEGLTVDMITGLMYTYNDGSGTLTWTKDVTKAHNTYGVTIRGTKYRENEDGTINAFEIGPPLAVTNVNGHCTSMVKGSSIYFMGEGNSLNTFGNDVFVYADLLVLKNNVTGGGRVVLDTYSSNKTHVLLFAVNDIKMAEGTAVFKAKTFYYIPVGDEGIDLYSIDPAEAETYYKGHIDYNALASGVNTLKNVRPLYERQGYPSPNMDIAFANSTQLGAIKNSEMLGWTEDGVLRGSNSTDNSGYAVCTYISDVSSASSISYTANRVLIAAKEDNINEVLTVPTSVTFTTRYLSIDAHTIKQENSTGAITLVNLGKSQSFIDRIKSFLGSGHVESRTLQIDYEQATTLKYATNSERKIPRQVYRYDNNTNIFGSGTLEHDIMVRYETTEINDWFSGGLSYITGSTVAILDRYVTIAGDAETNGSLEIPNSLFDNAVLAIYSNYIHFGKSVNSTNLAEGSIIINCQENGYTTGEYLGYFKSGTESYSGTLLYFEDDTVFITDGYRRFFGLGNFVATKTITIKKGFYYIYAKDGGTNLLQLTKAYNLDENGNPIKNVDLSENRTKAPIWVDPETLDDYSVYIRRDGGISSAYVETELDYTGSMGAFFGKAEVE